MSIDDLTDVSEFSATTTSTTSTPSTLQHSDSLCDLGQLDLEDDEWLFAPKKLTQTQKSIRPLTWLTQADDSSSDDDDDVSEHAHPLSGLQKKKTHPLSPYIPYMETAGDFAPWRRRGSAQSLASSTHSTNSTAASEATRSMVGDFPTAHVGPEPVHKNISVLGSSRENGFDIRSAVHFYNNLSVREDGVRESNGCDGIRGDPKIQTTERDTTMLDDLWKHKLPIPTEKKEQRWTTQSTSSTPEQGISRPGSPSSSISTSSSRTHVSANVPLREIPSFTSTSSSRPLSSLPIPNSPSSSRKRIPSSSSSTNRTPSSPNQHSSPRDVSPDPSLTGFPKAGKSNTARTPQADNVPSPIRSPTAARSRPTSLLVRYAPPSRSSVIEKNSLPPSRTGPTHGPRHVRSSPNLSSGSKPAAAAVSSSAERKPAASSVDRISRPGNSKSDGSKRPENVDPVADVVVSFETGARRRSSQRPDQSKLPVPRTNTTASAKSALPRPASLRNLR